MREWAVRASLAVAALAAAYGTVTRSLAETFRGEAPATAHVLAPEDGRAAAALARAMAGAEATPADRLRADVLARQALRRDPTAVAAAATLGLNAQIRGDTAMARRLFAYAQMLSRRDLPTHLWAIEEAVSRGDVAGALRHYDVALRTARSAPEILFPVLGAAISDPAIRDALARTLSGRPAWGDGLIAYLSGDGSDPRATASLFRALKRRGVRTSEDADAATVNRLISGGHHADAWHYYAAIRPGADRRVSRDPDFMLSLANPSPFDWTPISEAGTATSIQRGERGGIADFSAPASIGGPVLRQMQLLPAGEYHLDGRSAGIEQPEQSRPYWSLSCREGREFGRVVLPNSSHERGAFSGRFSVPSDCPVQFLTLVLRPSDLVGGVVGQIHRAQLRPVSANEAKDR